MPFASLRALSLYYELHGSGPPLLHISGSGNDLRRSAPAASPLNDHFLGLHYDQRGLGRTSLGDRPPAMVDFAEDAAALCEAVGWDPVSYTHLTLPTIVRECRSRWSPGH